VSRAGASLDPTDAKALWTAVTESLRARAGERNFGAWLAPLRCTWAEDALVLEAPTRTIREGVARHFMGLIEESVAQSLGRPCAIRLELAPALPALPVRGSPASDHTFDTFVVGESNGQAWTSARAVAAGASRAPLFLHGPSGVGKTHLLHAVFHAMEARGTRVTCLPAARLVAGLVAAYGEHGHEAFWRDIQPLGALLLDDVHSLAGQEEVQERLMEGLVAWVEGGRLLVLTSDRAPQDLPELAARVREHFEHGVVTRMDPPEPALRLAILQRKASALGLVLDTGLAARIAVEIGGNVRRLEGALTRLLAHTRLLGRQLDASLVAEVLPELRPRPPAPLTVDRILDETAAVFGASTRSLRGRSRRPELTLPRQVAMYLARKRLGRPFAELGAAFGRDHTTVLHAWQAVSARLESERSLAAIIEQIEQRLGAAAP
jgi:chromosomal replication initiator protein